MGYAPKFNINEFAKFFSKEEKVKQFFDIKEEEVDPLSKFVGHNARAKVSKNKLLETIESPSGDSMEIIQDFCQNGGVITNTNGKNLCIETDNGDSFELPRFCVKILQNG